jgi:hypothetical protein
MKRPVAGALLSYCLITGLLVGIASAQPDSPPASESDVPAGPAPPPSVAASFQADVAAVSTYVWRGQRLTNGWSAQPSGTISVGNFAFNVWGTLDLAASNEGDSLFLPGNPAAPSGNHSGLKGRFSEVDYTFSSTSRVRAATLEGGAIIYTFPERAATLRTTTELYGGATLDLPLAPSAALYVDVDESRAEGGATALYLKLGISRSLPIGHRTFPTVDLSSTAGFVNRGFGTYYYGAAESGAHDFNLTATLPIRISERWSAHAFLAYSALLGDFRELQYSDLREVYRGHLEPGKADTVWGGGSLSLAF